MFRSFFKDRKLVLLVVLLSGLMLLIVAIWCYYDQELQRIDRQINESKALSNSIEIPGDR